LSHQDVLFWIFSTLGIAGALGLLINRSPVYAALSLILNFFSIAGLYLSLSAEFLAAIQILVYAGAIMVLFLFVIMLLNLSDEPRADRLDVVRGMSFILGVAFVAQMVYIFYSLGIPEDTSIRPQFTFGSAEAIGKAMMTKFLFPFEMISVVLLAALVGAIVIARKHSYTNK
jgi:NADH-quinone oxidoreductase subunit J